VLSEEEDYKFLNQTVTFADIFEIQDVILNTSISGSELIHFSASKFAVSNILTSLRDVKNPLLVEEKVLWATLIAYKF
jgi:hypothetical protein